MSTESLDLSSTTLAIPTENYSFFTVPGKVSSVSLSGWIGSHPLMSQLLWLGTLSSFQSTGWDQAYSDHVGKRLIKEAKRKRGIECWIEEAAVARLDLVCSICQITFAQ